MESADKEDYEAKQKAFYSAMVAAWLNTRLERDKQLLGLSVAVIGFSVNWLRTADISQISQMILAGFTLLSFLVTIISVICIFGMNSTHIEKVLEGSETESRILVCLDTVAGLSFVVGMILIVISGCIPVL